MTAPSVCPACGATVRPDSPWCTLCYGDLRPKTEPEPEPEPEVVAAPEPVTLKKPDPLTAPLAALEGPTWPCTTCGAVNPMDADVCAACGASFLAAARSDSPLLELPVVGDITRLSKGQRFGLAGGVILAFVVLTVLLGLVLG